MNAMCEVAGPPDLKSLVATCLERVHQTPDAACWHFGGVDGILEGAKARLWLWRIWVAVNELNYSTLIGISSK